MSGDDPRDAVAQAAVRLLAAREYSRAELRAKLLAQGHAPEPVDSVLGRLVEEGLQSDARFIEHFVAQRQARGHGPRRIRAELAQRGIAGELIAAWVDEGDPSWRGLLQQVLTARFGSSPPGDRRELARRARFLEYRGFPNDLIRRALFD